MAEAARQGRIIRLSTAGRGWNDLAINPGGWATAVAQLIGIVTEKWVATEKVDARMAQLEGLRATRCAR